MTQANLRAILFAATFAAASAHADVFYIVDTEARTTGSVSGDDPHGLDITNDRVPFVLNSRTSGRSTFTWIGNTNLSQQSAQAHLNGSATEGILKWNGTAGAFDSTLKSSLFDTAPGNGIVSSLGTRAVASATGSLGWSDTLHLTAPGGSSGGDVTAPGGTPAGTTVQVFFGISLHDSLSVSGYTSAACQEGSAQATAHVVLRGPFPEFGLEDSNCDFQGLQFMSIVVDLDPGDYLIQEFMNAEIRVRTAQTPNSEGACCVSGQDVSGVTDAGDTSLFYFKVLTDGATGTWDSNNVYPTDFGVTAAAPEPATLALFAAGLAALGRYRRRR
jgi:hypothetical protein